MKKLLASDYDGTLRKTKVIDVRNINAIKKFRENNYFGLVTGRNKDFVDRNCKKFKYNYDFLIACNGAYIKCNDYEESIYMNSDIVKEIYEQYKDEIRQYNIHTNDCLYTTMKYGNIFINIKRFFIRKLYFNQTIRRKFISDKVLMSEITGFSVEQTQRIKAELKAKYKDQLNLYGDGIWFDIVPKGADKDTAFKKVIKLLNIDEKDAYCIGDSDNDVELLKNNINGYGIISKNQKIQEVAKGLVHEVYELIDIIMNGE